MMVDTICVYETDAIKTLLETKRADSNDAQRADSNVSRANSNVRCTE